MNKKGILSCVLIILILVTGCSLSKEKVKLSNKNQVTRYAMSHFGKAKYKEIESQTDDKIDYVFVDDEYNFEYNISSYKEEHTHAGGDKFYYSEITKSDFGGKYYDYIIQLLSEQVYKLEQKYNRVVRKLI